METGKKGGRKRDKKKIRKKKGECTLRVYASLTNWWERERDQYLQAWNGDNAKVAAMPCQSTFLMKRSNISFNVSYKSWQTYRDYHCVCQQLIMSISEFLKMIQKNSNDVCVMSYKRTWGNSTYINLKDDTVFH